MAERSAAPDGGWDASKRAPRRARRRPRRRPPEPTEIDIGVVELVEPLEIQVGYRLVGLVSKEREGGLLRRLRAVRRQVSREFGFLVPVVHVRDNPDLRSTGYRILVYGVERAAGDVQPDRLLAMASGKVLAEVQGLLTRDPVFGRPAHWILPADADQARAAGYTVFDASVVVATHFERIVRDHVETLFGRAELDAVLAYLGKVIPKLVEELTPKLLPLAVVHGVLCSLLAEQVPIRDLRTIVGALIDGAAATQEARALHEIVRQKLGGYIVQTVFGAVEELQAMALEPDLERLLQEVLRLAAGTGAFGIEPGAGRRAARRRGGCGGPARSLGGGRGARRPAGIARADRAVVAPGAAAHLDLRLFRDPRREADQGRRAARPSVQGPRPMPPDQDAPLPRAPARSGARPAAARRLPGRLRLADRRGGNHPPLRAAGEAAGDCA